VAILIAIAAAIALWGCGDDDDSPMQPEPNGPARSTPSELLNSFFKAAYTGQDSALYALMLDEAFTFRFLEEDADSLGDLIDEDNSWGKSADLASTYEMFGDPGITGITLNFFVIDEVPDTSCVACRRVETTVALRVETVGDGTEPLIFAVDAPQTFIVKPDPSDSTAWVILRQIDQPSSLRIAGSATPRTEGTSWGKIKGLFRPPPPPPSRSTPEKLMDYFEKAYSQRDSILYAEMLHEGFAFYFLVQDADSLRDIIGADDFWGRTLDLWSTGGLFRSQDVTGITLSILINSNTASTNEECLVCRQLETTITLRVATVGDGTEPLIYTVDSPQTFYVQPDPSDSTAWVIWRQVDRPSALKVAGL
jgi:hypothetical protein